MSLHPRKERGGGGNFSTHSLQVYTLGVYRVVHLSYKWLRPNLDVNREVLPQKRAPLATKESDSLPDQKQY
jgi:hypothetical protein